MAGAASCWNPARADVDNLKIEPVAAATGEVLRVRPVIVTVSSAVPVAATPIVSLIVPVARSEPSFVPVISAELLDAPALMAGVPVK